MSTDHEVEERTRSLAFATEAGDAPRLLVFWDGGFAARSLRGKQSLVVGRAQDCEVHVIHPSVSRRHVAVHVGPPLLVEDLGSANGTFVNGTRLPPREAVPLEPGTMVEAGGAMLVVHAPRRDQPERPLAATLGRTGPVEPALGAESAMDRVRRLVALVAVSGLSVILLGETGVGKDVIAETIHRASPRAKGPFIRLNCAAIPEALLESELFGYERGAFTGAVSIKPGLLEMANGGSFLLDEIAEMPLATQAKLLRAIESHEVLRVGGIEPRAIDVRFIAATNRDLVSFIADGRFRSDLYYRINGISIRVPPLRERLGEIESLTRSFVEQACTRAGRAVLSIDDGVVPLLQARAWAGNIRELKNVVERAVVLCEDEMLRVSHVVFDDGSVPPRDRVAPANAEATLNTDVASYERARILEALERAGGSQTRAAELLGISRRALVGRIATHGLPRPRKDRKG